MELKEAIRVLNDWNKAEEWAIKDTDYRHKDVYIERKEAIETVLQVLTIPDNKDVCFVGGGRTKGRTLTRTFEFGLIVGTKRERVYWEDKIKEKIEYKKLNCGNSFVIDELEELLKGE